MWTCARGYAFGICWESWLGNLWAYTGSSLGRSEMICAPTSYWALSWPVACVTLLNPHNCSSRMLWFLVLQRRILWFREVGLLCQWVNGGTGICSEFMLAWKSRFFSLDQADCSKRRSWIWVVWGHGRERCADFERTWFQNPRWVFSLSLSSPHILFLFLHAFFSSSHLIKSPVPSWCLPPASDLLL